MKKINALTPTQEAKLNDYRDKWLRIGLSTDPADRQRAEEGIIKAYMAAGLKPPRIIWCSSPLAVALTRAVVIQTLKQRASVRASVKASVEDSVGASVRASVEDSVVDSVRDSVWDSVWDSVRDSVWDSVADSVWDSVADSVGDSVGDSVRASVADSVRASVGDSVGASVGDSVRASVRDSVWASVWASVRASVMYSVMYSVGASVEDSVRASVGDSVRDSVYGQHDAHWLGFYDFFNEVGLQDIVKKLDNLAQVAQSAGWWLPHQHICWVSERTCIVNQDDQHRLHCEDGPAVAYPDGFDIYAWHGTKVPQSWIMDKNSLTPQIALTHDNIEQRRAACEILSWETILNELNAVTIDRDCDPEIGILVEVDIPDIGRERFLRVQCGTKRQFSIPVPPEMMTALEANAWTYAIEPDVLKQLEIRT